MLALRPNILTTGFIELSKLRIAVRDFYDCCENLALLRRDLLLFDNIAVPNLNLLANSAMRELTHTRSSVVGEMEYLVERGVILELTPSAHDRGFREALPQQGSPPPRVTRSRRTATDKAPEVKTPQSSDNGEDHLDMRINAALLDLEGNCEAFAILPRPPAALGRSERTISRDVAEIHITRLPFFADEVGWEEIIDFAEDNDLILLRERYRSWVETIGTCRGSLRTVREEYEDWANDWISLLKRRRVRVTAGGISTLTIVCCQAQATPEQLALKMLTTHAFSVRRTRRALLECENREPGREVIYFPSNTRS